LDGAATGIAEGAGRLKAKSFTLDGEAVVVGRNGLTGFEALPRRGSGDVAMLYAFDLLEYDGSDLRRMPLETRKATLASLLKLSGVIRFSEHISAEGPEVFAHACGLGAEGIVSKRLGSAYNSGLCHAWVKVKNPDAVARQRERAARWNR
jgi:bifunctional non-homologous end joining protein LigD